MPRSDSDITDADRPSESQIYSTSRFKQWAGLVVPIF